MKFGIGPAIENGFYYDFRVAEPFTPDDLKAIEKAMRKIVKQGQQLRKRSFASLAEAEEFLADQPYKLELLREKSAGATFTGDESADLGDGAVTVYDNVNPRTGEVLWSDMCRGPHVPTTKFIPAFHLTRSSAAYWRGDQKNDDLQRIYGTAWESQEAMDDYLDRMAEAAKRDHRRLGTELDLSLIHI